MLGDDDIVEPAADAFEAPVVGKPLLALLEAVAQLPPVFRRHHPALQAGLAGLVFLQQRREFPQALRRDRSFH